MEDLMYNYDFNGLKGVLSSEMKQHLGDEEYEWLGKNAALVSSEDGASNLNLSFSLLPRKTGSAIIRQDELQRDELEMIRSGFSVDKWPLHRLCRTWLLLHVSAEEKDNYCGKIETLFANAEMNELADLYASLSVLAFPKFWIDRCAEGVRSNMGVVLDAIMYENPYPSEYLDEAAWNQLVLKAFFTAKDPNRIIGIDERANEHLASTLVDYAHERWAADRHVNNQLWRLVGPFIDERNFEDLKKVFHSDDEHSRNAAALSLTQSSFEPAHRLLDASPELKNDIDNKKLKWIDVKP